MNLNTLTDTLASSSARPAYTWNKSIFCTILFLLVGCGRVGDQIKARELDDHMTFAYHSYATQPFTIASNSLAQYLSFLKANESSLNRFRNVDLLLYIAHVKLGYMQVCIGETNSCYTNFSAAYDLHKRLQLNAGMAPVQRPEFVDFVVHGMQELDTGKNVKWKSGYNLKSSDVEAVKDMFLLK